MIDNQIFAWGNYEENPNKMIGVDTIPTQKDATYNEVSDGVFTGSMAESFFTNVDKSMVPEVASVIGEVAMELVEGKGAVQSGVEIHYITNVDEYDAAMGTEQNPGQLRAAGYAGTTWSGDMAWAVAIVEKNCFLQVTANGTTNGVKIKDVKQSMIEVDNMFKRGTAHKYLIVDKGEVFVNDEPMADVTKIGFIAVA